MIDFLQRVAEFTINNTPFQPHETIIVLPNKRACLFLRNHLTVLMKPGQWLPAIHTIEEAIELWTGKQIADRLALKLLLIQIFIEQQEKTGHDLKAFIARADEMLNDFEDIDQQLVDANVLFQYLSEAKALELWHPDGSPLTEAECKYLDIYQSLSAYYNIFKAKLCDGVSGYKGLLTRILAEDDTFNWFTKKPHLYCIFAGFNALTRAEQTVFANLTKHGKAELLWDLDSYYMEPNRFQPGQAGLFLRRLREMHPQMVRNWVGSALLEMPKKVDILSVPGNVSQAKALGQLINDYIKKGQLKPERTAIVLADEKLLIPVLHSIPPDSGSFNVTMGLPFKQNPVYQLIDHLAELVESAITDDNKCYFRRKALAAFFDLSIFNGFVHQNQTLIAIRNKIKTHSSALVSAPVLIDFTTTLDLSDAGNSILLLMSRQNADIKNTQIRFILDVLAVIGDHVYKSLQGPSAQLIIAGLAVAEKMLNRIEKLFSEYQHVQDIVSFHQLIRSLSSSLNVPLTGEPIKGIQIMGMLETRSLDFDHVFILSANEGILPPAIFSNGFISHDIRIAYGLQGRREQQAVSAYHFFRLLQRPKHICLLYNSEPDVLGGGEKSRYILQIVKELSVLNPSMEIIESQMGIMAHPHQYAQEIRIEKTPEIIELLELKAKTGFSPTSLSNFVSCKLKFFLSEIASIREFKEPGYDTGMEVLGNIVHEALRVIYHPFVQRKIEPKVLLDRKNNIKNYVTDAYTNVVKQTVSGEGKSILIVEAAQHYIRQFIDHEIKSLSDSDAESSIISLEEELSIQLNTGSGLIKIKGTPDRIEKRGNEIHIIDYKTGKIDKEELKISDWDELIEDEKKSKALQLAIYILLFLSNNDISSEITVKGKILGFRSVAKGYQVASFPTTQNIDSNEYIRNNILNTVNALTAKIFDPQETFDQTTSTDTCVYCQFRNMCDR